MRKVKSNDSSIKTLMNHITCEMYTRQTLVSLFRCLVETIIESGDNSVILIKINDSRDFQGLLNRLEYSESRTYFYSNSEDLLKDEFLVIIADRFSACLFWEEAKSEILDLYQGFCSLNPEDSKKITEHLQSTAFNKALTADLDKIKQDRRNNEKFTTILKKFTESFENYQRDLICANTELKGLHDRLDQSEKLASIGQFYSVLAHEIRNPLGMINLYAKIISKNIEATKDIETGKSLKDAASAITTATGNLEDLLTQLLDFSKELKITKQSENLNDIVNEVTNLVKPAFNEKMVNLSFNNRLSRNFTAKIDKPKISQALLNIIKNALEVSKEGDLVQVLTELKNEKTVSIRIKDQGTGISPKDMEKLFTPFFTTKREGTGLGLARSKKIIEAHNGSLNVISSDKNGTTFELTLKIEADL